MSYKRGKLVFEKDQIVVGGDIRSLLYAAIHELPIVFHRPVSPFRFDLLPNPHLANLGFEVTEELTARQVWERLMFLLGLSGLVLSPEGPNSLRVDENKLVISTDAKSYQYNFKKLIVFDDQEITGLPRVKKETRGTNRVIDWVNVRSGCRHEHDYLSDSQNNFIKEIFFYPSDRSDNSKLKDLVAISYLSDTQLEDFDYSDTMARFKILKMMKEAGIRGARNGRDQKNPQRYKYYAVKVEPAERIVERDVTRYYEEDDRFLFIYDSVDDILNTSSKPKGYLGKLCEAL